MIPQNASKHRLRQLSQIASFLRQQKNCFGEGVTTAASLLLSLSRAPTLSEISRPNTVQNFFADNCSDFCNYNTKLGTAMFSGLVEMHDAKSPTACYERASQHVSACHGAMKALGISIGKNGQLIIADKSK
jgi:hypothetical protein